MNLLPKFGLALLLVAAAPGLAADLAVLRNGFSIRHERREQMGPVIRLYTTPDARSYVDIPGSEIDHFEKDLAPPPVKAAPVNPPRLDDVINTISDRHHIDPDLISSVIHAESGFNPRAVSRKGALGLMQLMPHTASQLGVTNPFDPGANVEGGTRYLRELLELYNFDLIKALAAYNAGPQRVQQYRGVPPYFETRAYVARVVRDYNRKKLTERQRAVASKGIPRQGQRNRQAPVKQTSVAGSAKPAIP